jgi:hypothetical protein
MLAAHYGYGKAKRHGRGDPHQQPAAVASHPIC